MKNLEIKVNDNITAFDTLVDAINYITEEIKRWFDSNDDKPFNVLIQKKDNKSPPLKINVNDGIGASGGLV